MLCFFLKQTQGVTIFWSANVQNKLTAIYITQMHYIITSWNYHDHQYSHKHPKTTKFKSIKCWTLPRDLCLGFFGLSCSSHVATSFTSRIRQGTPVQVDLSSRDTKLPDEEPSGHQHWQCLCQHRCPAASKPLLYHPRRTLPRTHIPRKTWFFAKSVLDTPVRDSCPSPPSVSIARPSWKGPNSNGSLRTWLFDTFYFNGHHYDGLANSNGFFAFDRVRLAIMELHSAILWTFVERTHIENYNLRLKIFRNFYFCRA